MNLLELIIFISSIVFGISLYWLEAKNNKLYRMFDKMVNSKELQMPVHSKKGFIVKRGFIPRLIFVNVLLIIGLIIILVLPLIKSAGLQYHYVSALLGMMIGIYIANFIIDVKDKSEDFIDKVVDSGKDFLDDIKEKGKEAASSFSSDKKEESTKTNHTSETNEKSARERLKDKGLLK
ncbi:YtxH domain-containing protein [Kordia zhangzhouensis]|uniref:YtxH domain-containing protein n=1 Tax=Kordia zhangzhouensis TaxID=1620405 RepID=UPI0006295929|nr:YtxH domain-containing protein [Kordia zhangzhouensis]